MRTANGGTLDQVLETLQDLVGQNRAVGLFSHLPLVQQAIPNGFRITQDRQRLSDRNALVRRHTAVDVNAQEQSTTVDQDGSSVHAMFLA
jgi:hypothetical protein